MGTTKESELHILGKSVFEDAEGKKIQLPAPPSPRFNPLLEHTVNKVGPRLHGRPNYCDSLFV